MPSLALEVDTPFRLRLLWDGSVSRGPREFLAGETPRLRATTRNPRTGKVVVVDEVTLLWLRDAEGADVLTDEAFTDEGDGANWAYQFSEGLEAGRYKLLAEARITWDDDDPPPQVVMGTDTIVVVDPS